MRAARRALPEAGSREWCGCLCGAVLASRQTACGALQRRMHDRTPLATACAPWRLSPPVSHPCLQQTRGACGAAASQTLSCSSRQSAQQQAGACLVARSVRAHDRRPDSSQEMRVRRQTGEGLGAGRPSAAARVNLCGETPQRQVLRGRSNVGAEHPYGSVRAYA